ncbi:MAG: hypothetical protein LUG60_08630 [Erysipelotrichaceae bacterium]|nr:hypothetical protein [Erysipelotrichaceae bacterium]
MSTTQFYIMAIPFIIGVLFILKGGLTYMSFKEEITHCSKEMECDVEDGIATFEEKGETYTKKVKDKEIKHITVFYNPNNPKTSMTIEERNATRSGMTRDLMIGFFFVIVCLVIYLLFAYEVI